MVKTKAVIYARYSSDQQTETSIDDQERLCRARADQEGWQVSRTLADNAVSGSTPIAMRPSGGLLIADLKADRFDVLIIEALDRLSRNQVEQEKFVRRLEFEGKRIVCISDGYDSNQQSRKLLRGMRGLVNEVYLDDLSKKTHRGLSGQVDRGYVALANLTGTTLLEAKMEAPTE